MNIFIIIIISIISIAALVMACIAFSRTFKHKREYYNNERLGYLPMVHKTW